MCLGTISSAAKLPKDGFDPSVAFLYLICLRPDRYSSGSIAEAYETS